MASWRLRGTVEPGMFPNERVFVVTDSAGNRFVAIVPVDLVDEAGKTVPVRLIGEHDDSWLVSVPGETASKAVSVKKSALIEA